MTRVEKIARAQAFRSEGLKLREIAQRMGVSTSTVSDYLTDPDRSKAVARKRRYGGTCEDCGGPTHGGNGHARAPDLCLKCSAVRVGAEKKIWTREAIIRAIQGWALVFGEPPAGPDWDSGNAARMKDEARLCRHANRRPDAWPTVATVVAEFGTWNTAIEIAGFAPRVANGGGANVARRRNQKVFA